MSYIVTLIVLSAVAYRISRFVTLDTLVEQPREKVFFWLLSRESVLGPKIHELLSCPYCITIWVSAATVAVHHNVVEPLPVPIWTWLTVAASSLLWWRAIDWED